MLKRNNFYLLILIEIIFLFIILIFIPSFFLIERSGTSQTLFENILPLDINHSYSQTFVSNKDYLNSVSVLLKNPALKSRDKVFINLQDVNKTNIQTLELSGVGIEDPGWVKLKFLPINSKKGDIFYLKINSNAKNDNDIYIYGNNLNQNINFKTTYKSQNIINSLKNNFNYQKDKILILNHLQTTFYLITVIIINILIFLSL